MSPCSYSKIRQAQRKLSIDLKISQRIQFRRRTETQSKTWIKPRQHIKDQTLRMSLSTNTIPATPHKETEVWGRQTWEIQTEWKLVLSRLLSIFQRPDWCLLRPKFLPDFLKVKNWRQSKIGLEVLLPQQEAMGLGRVISHLRRGTCLTITKSSSPKNKIQISLQMRLKMCL